MKKKAARTSRATSKTDDFKYVPNKSYKITECQDKPVTTETTSLSDDDDFNSGFGSYLRSSEGMYFQLCERSKL